MVWFNGLEYFEMPMERINWKNTSETKTAGKVSGHCYALFSSYTKTSAIQMEKKKKKSKTFFQGYISITF